MKSDKTIRMIIVPVLLLVLAACAHAASFDAYGADAVASIGGPDGPKYTSVEGVNSAIRHMSGRIEIDMLSDWGDERLVIPDGRTVILNMNGHMFNRGMVGPEKTYVTDGECIYVGSRANLTINGGSRETVHRTYIYVPTALTTHEFVPFMESISGGLITGGSSSNGAGGIHIQDNAVVTLNDVTVAGCRAEQKNLTDGHGGGVRIKGGHSTLRMNRSTIKGCFAYNDGGGIYADNHDHVRIEMNESHVDANYSGSDGGGINLDGEHLVIKGSGGSTVSRNVTKEYGGGIYLWNDDVKVSGLELEENKGAFGSAVAVLETGVTLKDLVIKHNYNYARTAGIAERLGAVYIANYGNTLDGCNVSENNAYGVYVTASAGDLNIKGKTRICDNEEGKNLILEAPVTRIKFNLKRGAGIKMSYEDPPEKGRFYQVSPDDHLGTDSYKAANCLSYLGSDDPDYRFTYNDSDENRKIYYAHKDCTISRTGQPGTYVTDDDYTHIASQDAGPQPAGRVSAGGELSADGDFELIRGYYHHQSTIDNLTDIDTLFYYTDGLFYGDPYVYNDHLATASWHLTFAGMYLREGNFTPASYKYKHAGARQFMADIGCPDQNIYVNDYMVQKPGTDSIGVTIASKNLQRYVNGSLQATGDILIPVVIRGGGYESEWASNVTLGDGSERDGEAKGFSEAADQVMESIDYYIAKYELQDELVQGRVKFWISGFSRAGAAANISAKRLVERYVEADEYTKGDSRNEVFAYTCEAPKGGTDKAEKLSDKTAYYCIHNMINAGDVVPLVGPWEMGFKRYGVDHYIPGTGAETRSRKAYAASVKTESKDPVRSSSYVSGVTTVTSYCDNDYLRSKAQRSDRDNQNYIYQREEMLRHLRAIDPYVVFDDYFQPVGVSFFPVSIANPTGSHAGTNREEYIRDFLSFVQGSSVPNRAYWASQAVQINRTDYNTLEQTMRETAGLFFGTSIEDRALITEPLSNIADAIRYLTFSSDISARDIYDDVIGDWHTLSGAEQMKYINYFWSLIEGTGALDSLNAAQKAKLQKNWPVIADRAFTYLDADWDTYPGKSGSANRAWAGGSDNFLMYSMTMMNTGGTTFSNHTPEIDMAWARSYDDYYRSAEDFGLYDVQWGDKSESYYDGKSYETPAPKAFVLNEENLADGYEGMEELVDGGDNDAANVLYRDERIYLDVPDVTGEAIYYTLTDISSDYGEVDLAIDRIYRGGIDLPPLGAGSVKRYRITAYARSYGKNSNASTYYVDLRQDRHNVLVIYNAGMDTGTDAYSYAAGERVTLTAKNMTDRYFTHWTVTDGQENDVTAQMLGSGGSSSADSRTISFTMPEVGGSGNWGEDYSLRFTAHYAYRIKKLTVKGLDAPVAGGLLDETAEISFDNLASDALLPVSWTYEAGEGEDRHSVIDSGEAYQNTVYTASISVPQDQTGTVRRLFAMQQHLTAELADSTRAVTVSKNSADGSVTLSIVFDATGSEGGQVAPEDPVELNIAIMLNTGDAPQSVSYKVIQGDIITLTAPDAKNSVFSKWDLRSSGLKPVDASNQEITDADEFARALQNKTVRLRIPEQISVLLISISAEYDSVLSGITASVAAPEAGRALADSAELIISLASEFEVDPTDLELVWSPSPAGGRAAYMTPYTLTIGFKPDQDGNIRVRETGGSGDYSRSVNPNNLLPADEISVKVNGKDAVYDAEAGSLSLTFDAVRYRLMSVRPVGSIGMLPHGTDAAGIKKALPDTTQIVLDNGSERDVKITWDTPEMTSGGGLDESVWTAGGSIELPDDVEDPDGIGLTMDISVRVAEADTVSAPAASLESGAYTSDLYLRLSCSTDGAEIRYTTDGSDPASPGAKIYDGEEIAVIRSRDAGGMTLRATASREGMRTSSESVYIYTFKDEETPGGGGDPSGPDSGGEDGLKAEDVIKMIDELPSPASASDEKQVKEARAAYDSLTEGEKAKVPEEKLGRLVRAEQEVKEAADREAAAQALSDAKRSALKELDGIKLSKYKEPERSLVKAAKEKAMNAIAKASDIADVDAAMKSALATIGKQGVYDPELPKIISLKTVKGRKSLTARWKKLSRKNRKKVTGIEVCIASDRKFTKGRIIRKAGRSKGSRKISGLRSKKTYYVKARTYIKKNGVKRVGKWSKVRRVRIR